MRRPVSRPPAVSPCDNPVVHCYSRTRSSRSETREIVFCAEHDPGHETAARILDRGAGIVTARSGEPMAGVLSCWERRCAHGEQK